MAGKREKEDEALAPNHSDSDDWTLVSPPESANNSPTSSAQVQENDSQAATAPLLSPAVKSNRESAKKRNRAHKECDDRRQVNQEPDLRASGSQDADDEEDDGLVEIDLNVDDEIRSNAKPVAERVVQSNLRSRKATKSVEFAQLVVHQQTIAKTRDCSTNTQVQALVDPTTAVGSIGRVNSQPPDQSGPIVSGKSHLEETSGQEQRHQQQADTLPVALTILHGTIVVLMIASSILAYELQSYFLMHQQKLRGRAFRDGSSNESESELSLLYLHPMDTANLQLMLLDRDLDACVKGKGYGWIEEDGRLTHPRKSGRFADKYSHKRFKPFRGMVCYEREEEWRKRFKKLKDEYNIDLRRMVLQSYKRMANDLLGHLNPNVKFNLIVNQLEYLEYLDEHRHREQFERLKAENLELKKHLMNNASCGDCRKQSKNKHDTASTGNDHSQLKSVARLENENGRLRSENEALKASLVEKAGTVYIKQSLELEKCERENNRLREFHQQTAQEVSKRLKQLDLHTIDAAALLNDHESLSSQLALTHEYLLRLGEEVFNLVTRNKNIERESQFYKSLLDTLASTSQAKQIERSHDTMPSGAQHLTLNEAADPLELLGHQDIEDPRSSDNKSAINEDYLAATTTVAAPTKDEHSESTKSATPADIAGKVVDSRGNWLLRRAKLRERLRKSSGIDILEKQIDRLIDQNKHLYKSADRKHQPDHHYDKQSNHNHHRKHSKLNYYDRNTHDSPPRGENYISTSNKKYSHENKIKDASRQQDKLVLLKQLEAEIANFRYDL